MKKAVLNDFVLFAALCCIPLAAGCVKDQNVMIGEPAPAISAVDLNDNTIKLSTFRGNVVVLRFWSSRCKACAAEMPVIDRFGRKYRDKGLIILAVNRGDTKEEIEKFAESLSISFPVLLDPAAIASRKYGITAVPTTVFIDRKGIAKKVVPGEMTLERFEKVVVEMLGEK